MRKLFWAFCLLLVAFAAWADGPVDTGGGGGPKVPGLVDGVCYDDCVEYLNNLQTFEALPNWPRVHFSSKDTGAMPMGNDSWEGTPERPLLSLNMLEDVLERGDVIAVMDGDVWDNDSANMELANWDGTFINSIQASDCGESGGLARKICAYIVPYDLAALPTIDCVNVDSSVLKGTITNQVFSINAKLGIAGLNIRNCPSEPDRDTAGGNFQFTSTIEVTNNAALGVFVNMQVDNAAGEHVHPYRGNGSADIILINSGGSGRDMSDFNSDCSGPTCHHTLCAAENDPFDACQTGTPSLAAGAVHTLEFNGSLVVVSRRTLDIKNTQYSATTGPVGIVQDTTVLSPWAAIIGPTIKGPLAKNLDLGPISLSGCFASLFPIDTSVMDFYLARMRCLPWPSDYVRDAGSFGLIAFRMATNDASGVEEGKLNGYLFQNVVSGFENGIYSQGQFELDDVYVEGQCNIIENLHVDDDGDGFIVRIAGSTTAPGASVRFNFDESNVYDPDDATDSFLCSGQTEKPNAQQVERQCGSTSHFFNDDFFGSTFASGGTSDPNEGPGESGGLGTDGNVFVSAGGADFTTKLMCAAGKECQDLCAGRTFTIPIARDGFRNVVLPASLVGEEIHTFVLSGDHWPHAGSH